jgi:hypothetical protein
VRIAPRSPYGLGYVKAVEGVEEEEGLGRSWRLEPQREVPDCRGIEGLVRRSSAEPPPVLWTQVKATPPGLAHVPGALQAES